MCKGTKLSDRWFSRMGLSNVGGGSYAGALRVEKYLISSTLKSALYNI